MKHTLLGTNILTLTTVIETELLKQRGITITEMIEQDKSIPYVKSPILDNPVKFYDKPQSKYHK